MADRYLEHSWYTRSDVDWAYVRINRTGSSWFTNYLTDNDFVREDPRKLKNHHKLVILRHPIDRFLSGVAFFDEIDDIYDRLVSHPSMTVTQYITDPHIKPQSLFLRDVDLNNCTFIQYNNKIPKNIESFLKERNTIMENPPQDWTVKITPFIQTYKNATIPLDRATQVRYNLMNLMAKNLKFENKIKSYFVDDFKLYDNVRWYGTN